ncbi:hypothetical protein ACFQY7_36030 [Actinomadura luteofluorescens]|nr:hypothetical protein [Actinomadura luteofluorescens]
MMTPFLRAVAKGPLPRCPRRSRPVRGRRLAGEHPGSAAGVHVAVNRVAPGEKVAFAEGERVHPAPP